MSPVQRLSESWSLLIGEKVNCWKWKIKVYLLRIKKNAKNHREEGERSVGYETQDVHVSWPPEVYRRLPCTKNLLNFIFVLVNYVFTWRIGWCSPFNLTWASFFNFRIYFAIFFSIATFSIACLLHYLFNKDTEILITEPSLINVWNLFPNRFPIVCCAFISVSIMKISL